MAELKPLTREAIARALEKAERYRFLNEPVEAESICLDVLVADPKNQAALVTLLLSLTDQFEEGLTEAVTRARDVLPRLGGEYEKAYYAGIIAERKAKAQIKGGGPGSGYAAFESLQEAMSFYGKAEDLRPPGNDDALLRWNTCARILERHSQLRPAPVEVYDPPLE